MQERNLCSQGKGCVTGNRGILSLCETTHICNFAILLLDLQVPKIRTLSQASYKLDSPIFKSLINFS